MHFTIVSLTCAAWSGVACGDRPSGFVDGVERLLASERPVAVYETGPEDDSGDHAEQLRRCHVEVVHIRGPRGVRRLEVAPERGEYGQRAEIESPLAHRLSVRSPAVTQPQPGGD